MSQEKVLKTLGKIGFSQLDARVFVLLSKRGPKKAMDVAKALKIPKQTLYLTLKNLEKRGIITSTLEHPARFSAESLEKVLDLFVKSKVEEAKRIQRHRIEILADWQSIAIADSDETPSKFSILEGRNSVYSKIQQMLQEAERQLLFVSTLPNLARVDQFGLFDSGLDYSLNSKIRFKFITDVSSRNLKAIKQLLEKKSTSFISFEGRTPELSLSQLPRMVIRDENEALFFIDPNTDFAEDEKDYVCLWTNCKTLVNSFSILFEDLWSKSTDIRSKILELENGNLSSKICIFENTKLAKKKYEETLRLAKREITIMTSPAGLCVLNENSNLLYTLSKKGISVKIMAPIINENLEAAKQLLAHFNVKHVPIVYPGAAVVDGQHFFQFKNPQFNRKDIGSIGYFEDTFYTDDHDYVKRAEKMLNDIWKNASTPTTTFTLQSIISPIISHTPAANFAKSRYSEYRKISGWIEDTEESSLTEKDVLEKIINAKRIKVKNPLKDIGRAYCSSGLAVIHPPDQFNLPSFIIIARHVDKQSSMGAEDMIAVYLWLETPIGKAYVRAATAGDSSRGVNWRKGLFKDTPAQQYCHLLKKDEIQVRLHGNTLFAGWTVPIPLFPPPYALPPACILFEGYGELKTGVVKTRSPIGRTELSEFNGFDAFVTFFHPVSKYSGPGTDGLLRRDLVMTSYPPSE